MNNKLIISLAMSLFSAGSILANKTGGVRLNQPFDVRISNESNGLATVTGREDIKGARRGDHILDNQSKIVVVEEEGAKLSLSFGPEGKKAKETVRFYGKTSPNPVITLSNKGLKTQGFNTQRPKAFAVLLVNNSGGQVTVVNGHNFNIKNGTIIQNGQTLKASISPSSSATFKMGPEANKKMYTVIFSNQSGKNPQLLFEGQTMFNRGITSKNVITQIRPATQVARPVYINTRAHKAPNMKATNKKQMTTKNAQASNAKQTAAKAVHSQKAVQ